MTETLLIALTLLCIAIIAWSFMQPVRLLQLPFLSITGFAGYLLPQFVALSTHDHLPPGALDKTLFMALLCVYATYAGYAWNVRPARMFHNWEFSRHRLELASIVLTLAGGYFFYRVSQLAAEVSLEHGGAWTGPITIYFFFSRLLTFGFAIACFLVLRRATWPSLIMCAAGVLIYSHRIIISGRRSALIEFGLIVALALYFTLGWKPSRLAVITAVLGAALFVNSVGDYRSTMLEGDRTTWTGHGLDEVMRINFIGNFQKHFSGRAPDARNAVYRMEAVEREMKFNYGLSLWDSFVQRYIPGQIIGHDLKRSLQVAPKSQHTRDLGYRTYFGTTPTGISDAFLSFWYLGAFAFFLIGYISNRWFRAAQQGSLAAQFVVVLTVYSAIIAFPFSNNRYFLEFVTLTAFLLPVLWIARTSDGTPAPVSLELGASCGTTPSGHRRHDAPLPNRQ